MIPQLMISDFMPILNYPKYQNNFHFATDSLFHSLMSIHTLIFMELCPLILALSGWCLLCVALSIAQCDRRDLTRSGALSK